MTSDQYTFGQLCDMSHLELVSLTLAQQERMGKLQRIRRANRKQITQMQRKLERVNSHLERLLRITQVLPTSEPVMLGFDKGQHVPVPTGPVTFLHEEEYRAAEDESAHVDLRHLVR